MTIPDHVIDAAIERYRSGMTIVAASKGLCAPMTLWRRMHERGEPVRKRGGGNKPGPADPERSIAIYRRYRSGEPSKEIAKSVGFKRRSSVHWHVWQAERVLLDRLAAGLPSRATATREASAT